jgi:hypothetical protein
MTPPGSSAAPISSPSPGAAGHRWSDNHAGAGPAPALVLTAIGSCCVVLGGLVSAVTAPLGLAHGSWAAAYLVLVGGVTQYAMGHSRARHPNVASPSVWAWAQVATWNLGNVAVIGGTLTGKPMAVDLGSVLLVVALVIALNATRPPPAARAAGRRGLSWGDRGYRLLLLVLVLSIPVGIVLAHVRHS